jgi:hypothetical protein
MKSIFKYSLLAYILLGFLFLYELNLGLSAKKSLDKRVQGVSTQIKEIENYTEEISNFTNDY